MVRRESFVRAATVAAAAVAFLSLSCGGGGSPSSSTPPVTATPTPVPSPGGGTGAASCPFGVGTLDSTCSRDASSRLLADVDAAIEQVAREKPGVLDVNDQAIPGTGQYRVLNPKAFIDGVVANLQAMGNCAQSDWDFPLEVIQAKDSSDFSEDFDLVTSKGFVRRGIGSYRQTCTPAAFPVDPSNWPPKGSGCTKPYPGPVTRFAAKIKNKGRPAYTLDSTPLVGPDYLYCASIGYTDGRVYCPVRPEGSPERIPCENWRVGHAKDTGRPGPTWTLDDHYCTGPESGCENTPGSQYNLWAYKGGIYRVCAENGVCGKVGVEK